MSGSQQPPLAARSTIRGGDSSPTDFGVTLYDEIRRLAAVRMRQERADHTLQPTAVVHEVFLKLARAGKALPSDRACSLARAAAEIRRILVDHARGKLREKRGGGRQRESLPELVAAAQDESPDVLGVHEALETMARIDPRRRESWSCVTSRKCPPRI